MFNPVKCSIRKQRKGFQMRCILLEINYPFRKRAILQVVQTLSCNLKVSNLFFDTEDL